MLFLDDLDILGPQQGGEGLARGVFATPDADAEDVGPLAAAGELPLAADLVSTRHLPRGLYGEQAAREDYPALKTTVNATLRVILALTIPLAAILIAGIHPIIPILGFDESVSQMIVWTSRAYMLGLVGYSIQELTARAFYAHQDARTPLITTGANQRRFTCSVVTSASKSEVMYAMIRGHTSWLPMIAGADHASNRTANNSTLRMNDHRTRRSLPNRMMRSNI